MRPQLLNPAQLVGVFRKEFELCQVKRGETIVLLTNLNTRRDYVQAGMAAAEELGADIYEIGISRAVSHLGFGLHPHAHWDQNLLHGNEPDRLDSSARVFAGNFLFSTGPNNDMGGKRDTKGHIDTPMCDCTVLLDNELVLERGKFVDPKMIVPPAWG